LRTIFGKAATNRVPTKPPLTLPVTGTDSKTADSLKTIALATETEKVVADTRKEMNNTRHGRSIFFNRKVQN